MASSSSSPRANDERRTRAKPCPPSPSSLTPPSTSLLTPPSPRPSRRNTAPLAAVRLAAPTPTTARAARRSPASPRSAARCACRRHRAPPLSQRRRLPAAAAAREREREGAGSAYTAGAPASLVFFYGYARVTVEDIVQGFEDLDIDIATPEGATRLGDVKRQFILWQKKFIKFLARRQQVHPPTVVVVAAVAVVAVVVVVLHLHLLHEGRRRPQFTSGGQALAFKRNQDLAEKQEKKALEEAEKKLERGKEVAQLGEQSKQSIAPLIVQAAGLDEAPMKDAVFTYVKNGPLIEPAQEEDLPRQMKGLLNWYKSYIKLKNAKDYIYAEVRAEHHFKHYYIAVQQSELFQLFNLRDLDKSIISCYVLMKKREMQIRNIHDVGFIDPYIVNSYVLEHHPADVEEDLWRFLRKQELKSDILFPYHFGFHWILMVIQFHTSTVLVHDSLNMDAALWADMRK
ncbi:hypothetical protein QYE76_013552 [Lolium multiflorum]|uniref:DUF8039 domain-containing protein n=1 Tax=Lolium multiflorum TaxID=4521 RepID=A0AAD8U3A0_LOLMU|nr:hypothetical protein QYE76_013552 [Lolium multiflorum]